MEEKSGNHPNMEEMFDKELAAVLEEKARLAKEHPGATIKKERQSVEEIEKELMQHPFFMKELPKEGEPLPPMLEAFQQLKYSDEVNSKEELLETHKQDGLFHFKLKKWRTSALYFTHAMTYSEDKLETAKLFNNRAACMWYLENYGSCLKDCEKALGYDETYTKAFTRALNCCSKLSKWEKMIQLHRRYFKNMPLTEEEKTQVDRLNMQGVRNSKFEASQQRKSEHVRKLQDDHEEKIIEAIVSRGVKMRSKKFLKRDREISSDHCVQLTSDGDLLWPVLIFYPHLAESDIIREFYEKATFQEELVELLNVQPPPWDKDKEFVIENVDVYFTDAESGKYVKVDILTKLADVLRHKRFFLPENGIPSFLVLARGNPVCEMMLARMSDHSS